jgi:hypothetical protein
MLFMALMMFISGVKLFHSHHDLDTYSSRSSASSVKASPYFSLHQVSKDKHCPICDFNLMKDADMAHSDIHVSIRESVNAVFASPLQQSLHQFSIPGRGRAPPAFLS